MEINRQNLNVKIAQSDADEHFYYFTFQWPNCGCFSLGMVLKESQEGNELREHNKLSNTEEIDNILQKEAEYMIRKIGVFNCPTCTASEIEENDFEYNPSKLLELQFTREGEDKCTEE